MSAILYLFICIITGYVICSFAVPDLGAVTEMTYGKKSLSVSKKFILYPAWFFTGTILVTWTVYILACIFHNQKEPLLIANAIAMVIFFLFSTIGILMIYKRKSNEITSTGKEYKLDWKDGLFLGLVFYLGLRLMWTTFFVEHGQLYVGISIFSDFSPHIGMIRSFSKGNNFPTSYCHFAGQDIKYHFMYQFLVGNLEFLGMRLDFAMNIPSIIGFISSFLLLFVLAVKMSGKRMVGYLSCLFFAFRSSKTLFTFLSQVPKGTSILKALSDNSAFISSTPNEDWGLWNLNVYANQRHLAFTIPLMLLIITLYLPPVYENMQRLCEVLKENESSFKEKIIIFFKVCFISWEAWKIENVKQCLFTGILLGALAFWNGAVTIATLLVLFVCAIVAKRKLEYLILAVLTTSLSFIQSSFFISGNAVKPKFFFGFIAEVKTLFGTLDYIDRLLGILPIVLLLAFFIVKKTRRYLLFAFAAPFIFSFCVSLTIDVMVNHKYIMLSLMLLGIFAAIAIEKLWSQKKVSLRVISIGLIFALTATGVYDYTIVLKKNNPKNSIVLDLNSELTEWIMDHTTAKDIVLSSNYALNQVVLGGGMLYLGWPYFGWSAGYDTNYRAAMVKAMFEAQTPLELDTMVKENDIRFIIIDHDARTNKDYTVNEENIAKTYRLVYESGDGEWSTLIYDTYEMEEE